VTAEAKPDREVYFIREPSDGRVVWTSVDRAKFARHDGPSVACLASNAAAEIASQEGIPAECVNDRGVWAGSTERHGRMFIPEFTLSHLKEAMDYVKLKGHSAILHTYSVNEFRRALGKDHRVVVAAGYHYVIDGAWVYNGGTLSYDPHAAIELLNKAKEEQKIRDATPKVVRSKISHRFFYSMFAYLRSFVDMVPPFGCKYSGYRAWGSRDIARINDPTTKQQTAEAITEIIRFIRAYSRKEDYRTYAWKKCLEIFFQQYAKDVLMKGRFARIMREEWKAVRDVNYRAPRKWSSYNGGDNKVSSHRHRWEFWGLTSDAGIQERCSVPNCCRLRYYCYLGRKGKMRG